MFNDICPFCNQKLLKSITDSKYTFMHKNCGNNYEISFTKNIVNIRNKPLNKIIQEVFTYKGYYIVNNFLETTSSVYSENHVVLLGRLNSYADPKDTKTLSKIYEYFRSK